MPPMASSTTADTRRTCVCPAVPRARVHIPWKLGLHHCLLGMLVFILYLLLAAKVAKFQMDGSQEDFLPSGKELACKGFDLQYEMEELNYEMPRLAHEVQDEAKATLPDGGDAGLPETLKVDEQRPRKRMQPVQVSKWPRRLSALVQNDVRCQMILVRRKYGPRWVKAEE
ncbi:hypothetical protein MARPO_0106s0009 [Marchantia polymorpha]|nr:hypothetical protein MARPO_0106s0009 [Marchantia polymorpha]|eukprot:PTQ31806.1 hypothetical protein MARPO_0106s0009 [Marchantia polymorpha]